MHPLNSSDSVQLNALTLQDLPDLIQNANNKKIWDRLRNYFPHPYTQKDASEFLIKLNSENPKLTFAIRSHSKFCGIIGLNKQSDVYEKSLEMGYWLGEAFWNQGIASKAVSLITHYASVELQCPRIFSSVFEYNVPSMRVLEKNGYQLEGRFRKAIFKNGQFFDEYRFAYLND